MLNAGKAVKSWTDISPQHATFSPIEGDLLDGGRIAVSWRVRAVAVAVTDCAAAYSTHAAAVRVAVKVTHAVW